MAGAPFLFAIRGRMEKILQVVPLDRWLRADRCGRKNLLSTANEAVPLL